LGGLAASEQYVIFGNRDPADQADVFQCISAVDGSTLWTVVYPASGQLDYGNTPRTTPLLHDGLAITLGAFGDLSAIELATGNLLWRKRLSRDFGNTEELPWGFCGSPLIANKQLVVMPGAADKSLLALQPRSGEIVWATPNAPPAYGSLITREVAGTTQIVGYDRHALNGWDSESGKRLWTHATKRPDDFNVPTPLMWNDRLIVASENNGTRILELRNDGTPNPRPPAANPDLAPDTVSPVVSGSCLVGIWNEVYCLDLNDKLHTRWTHAEKGLATHGSCFASGDRVLMASGTGALILIRADADDWHELLTAARPMAGLQFQLGSLEEGTFQLKVGFLFCQ
jgi:outer membrane protein assembly factor BamB